MGIRDQFPNEESLKNHFGTNIQYFVDSIRESVGSLEAEYIQKSKRRSKGMKRIGTGVGILIVVSGISDSDSVSGMIVVVLLLLGSPVAAYLIWTGKNLVKGTSEAILTFNNGLNEALYPLVFNVFGLTAESVGHTKKDKKDFDTSIRNPEESFWQANLRLANVSKSLLTSPETDSVLSLLDHSELITEGRNRVVVDDMINSEFASRSLFLSELDVKHVTGSGKNRKVKKIFHGYFISHDLPKTLTGKTFVSTEGDRKGFGHQSFWKSKSGTEVKKTELEWSDFEDKLHVVTDDPVEARYILTPDFMSDLYDWWTNKEENIRISFISNRMYILFPDKKVRMGKTIKKIDPKEVGEYLESIGIPLLHVLHLVEDLET